MADTIRDNAPDVALIDLGLPDGSGIDVLRELRRVQPEALYVITTVMGNDANIVAALSVGANGYLLKEQPAERIIRQLSQLAEGIPALSPSIAQCLMAHSDIPDLPPTKTTRSRDGKRKCRATLRTRSIPSTGNAIKYKMG